MTADGRAPEPTEAVFLPAPSMAPMFTGVGLALVAIGLFAGLVPLVAGAVVSLAAIRRWLRDSRRSFQRLPREQGG